MKAELKFEYNPDDPDDVSKINRMQHADDAYYVLFDMTQYFRQKWKYSEDEAEIKFGDEGADYLNELMSSNGINLDSDYL